MTGFIPRWLVTTSDGFVREAFGVPVPRGARCLVAGIDLVRDEQGAYCVLQDNLRNPSGISYVLENRAAMTRVLPAAFVRTPSGTRSWPTGPPNKRRWPDRA
ncbi:MAG: circularly permuted type 2 ATP-grasp protein [Acidimicrobiales bacterium]